MQPKNIVTAFISFDLVNCTSYKSTHKGCWASGVSSILTYITNIFEKMGGDAFCFWKVLGDEIVFTNKITSLAEIDLILQEVYEAVIEINQKIKNAEIGDETTKDLLSTKATVWAADLSYIPENADNYYVEYNVGERSEKEYIGTDIDAGFRISKYTTTNRVVISYEIAALYLKEAELYSNINKINFVGHRYLKGIWEGRNYPIFMYHGDKNISFEQSVIDDIHRTELLDEYILQSDDIKEERTLQEHTLKILTEYSKERYLSREVDELVDIINGETNDL